jgi:hypothetical protein
MRWLTCRCSTRRSAADGRPQVNAKASTDVRSVVMPATSVPKRFRCRSPFYLLALSWPGLFLCGQRLAFP